MTSDDLATHVVAMYLADGEDHTVKEIAASLDMKGSAVRRLLVQGNGFPIDKRIRHAQEARASYSKNYPGMESGAHRVWVYGPTREALRIRVNAWERPGS